VVQTESLVTVGWTFLESPTMAPKKNAATPKAAAGGVQKKKPAGKAAPAKDAPTADQTNGALTIERWCVTPCIFVRVLLIGKMKPVTICCSITSLSTLTCAVVVFDVLMLVTARPLQMLCCAPLARFVLSQRPVLAAQYLVRVLQDPRRRSRARCQGRVAGPADRHQPCQAKEGRFRGHRCGYIHRHMHSAHTLVSLIAQIIQKYLSNFMSRTHK